MSNYPEYLEPPLEWERKQRLEIWYDKHPDLQDEIDKLEQQGYTWHDAIEKVKEEVF